jgi:hypothetical protein
MTGRGERGARSGGLPRRAALLVVVIALLLGAVIVGDGIVRAHLADTIADRVRATLRLEPRHLVEVRITGASVLWQLASGRLSQVDIETADVPLGELRGDIAISARSIPTDLSLPVGGIEAELRIEESELGSIASALSAAVIDDVRLEDGEIRFLSVVPVLGFDVDVGVGLLPGVQAGAIAFTPSTFVLEGRELDLRGFTDRVGPFGSALLSTRTVCIAEHVPRELALQSVRADDEHLVIVLRATRVVLQSGSIEYGVC